MTSIRRMFAISLAALAGTLVFALFAPPRIHAQEIDPGLFSGMRWRLIGPFRGGRALAATGVPGQPNVFYFGAVGGGVWKTTNAGRTWEPIFDAEPIASIGAIAVAPSDPNIIYVGSGEADMRDDISYGNGMYRSTDAGKTWTRIGLEDSRQVGQIVVDPHNPDRLWVAALGHAYGANSERGVFRSTNGGQSWEKVLFKDENTGAIDLALDPRDARTVYAVLWQTRRPPWDVYPPSYGKGSGLYKSTDGGDTWQQLSGHGLPAEGLGRMGISISRALPDRIYLLVDAKEGGVYRSDDGGANWQRTDSEARIWGRGWYFGGITADPAHPDVVYVCNTSTYRSTDGGKNFDAVKGAPGGDDYHSLWISPEDPARMILASDQGVVISVDGARTWSSWYNQPTAQFYHVVTDTHFPYWVCGPQQDSGSLCIESRSHAGTISSRDWRPIGVGGESQYVAPDPLDPDILYGGSFGAAVGKYNLATGETQDIAPSLAHPGDYRHTWTLPTVFSPRDPHELYFSTQILFRTKDAGNTWQVLSPDLTREDPGAPPNLDPVTAADVNAGKGKRRGVIYTIAPSPLMAGEIWVGTDDGLIQVTRDDGKTWRNVTPPGLTPWSKVGLLEVSRHDRNTVYAAIDRHRLEDLRPHIYRTHDGGKLWQEIVKGIPAGSYVNAVREDPERKGLLYAGTETGVFVSFNDGDEWQPLQLNLPNCSVRDLVIHADDLVIATHGRSFWILDDLTPLRQASDAAAGSEAYLFRPEVAYRIRAGGFEGTPMPFDVPQGENPPDGAFVDYYLKQASSGPVSLEVLDSRGRLVRRYSSEDKEPQVDLKRLDIPAYWIHPPVALALAAGMHRFVWDLRYLGVPRGNPMMRMFGMGAGPWALPGEYQVKLTVNGKSYTQPLILKMDPRVKTSQADLVKQFEMAEQIGEAQGQVGAALATANRLHGQLQSLATKTGDRKALTDQIAELDRKTVVLAGSAPGGTHFEEEEVLASDIKTLRSLNTALDNVGRAVGSADVAPTGDADTAYQRDRAAMQKILAQWEEVKNQEVPKLNSSLKEAGLQPVVLEEGARQEGK
ncbi:MAG: WD40/YVTN/BNR-like repeat-containing protein [Terriglobia bacterium]